MVFGDKTRLDTFYQDYNEDFRKYIAEEKFGGALETVNSRIIQPEVWEYIKSNSPSYAIALDRVFNECLLGEHTPERRIRLFDELRKLFGGSLDEVLEHATKQFGADNYCEYCGVLDYEIRQMRYIIEVLNGLDIPSDKKWDLMCLYFRAMCAKEPKKED